MQIDVGAYAVNQLLSGDPQLFTMPSSAAQAVDLAALSGPPPSAPYSPSTLAAPAPSYAPSTSSTAPWRTPPPAAATPINYSAGIPAASHYRGTVR
jgi:hypothetical protein